MKELEYSLNKLVNDQNCDEFIKFIMNLNCIASLNFKPVDINKMFKGLNGNKDYSKYSEDIMVIICDSLNNRTVTNLNNKIILDSDNYITNNEINIFIENYERKILLKY